MGAALRESDDFPDADWLDNVARRLRRQWPSLDDATLNATATEIASDPVLGALPPHEAAEAWLAPIAPRQQKNAPEGA